MKNYVSTENSLKRFLKRKVKITMGFVVAFMIMGNIGYAEEYVFNEEVNTMIKNKNEGNWYIYNNKINISNAESNSKGIWNYFSTEERNIYNFNDNVNINLSADNSQAINSVSGIMTFNKEVTLISGSNALTNSNSGEMTFKDTINLTSNRGYTLSNSGIINFEEDVVITQNGIKILSDYMDTVYGVNLGDNSETNFKKQLSIRVGSQERKADYDNVAGINAGTADNKEGILTSLGRTDIEVYSENSGTGIEMSNLSASFEDLDIKVNAKKATGIKVSNNSKLDITKNLNISLEGEELETGIEIHKGEINLTGNVNIYASGYAIKAGNEYNEDYNGIVRINENKDSTIKISGKIETFGISQSSIDIIFSNSNSEFTGNTIVGNQNSNINMEFSDNSIWNNTGDSNVTNLTLNNGIINNTSVENNITVETLKGNGGTVNMASVVDETTGTAASGKITINNIEEENVKLDVNFENNGNVEADENRVEKYFEELAKNIETKDSDSKITGNMTLDEGFVSGGYEADITVDNTGSKIENITSVGLNSMVEGMRDLATINLLTWRQEMNSLNKRMGELRNSTGEHGVWSRVYAGKIENGSQYDNEYQSYQVGYDKKYLVDNGTVFVGALVSYTDGETNYKLGSGENYSVGVGVYATWLNNDGQFADVILKQSRLHNKFDVTSKDGDKSQHGDYNNWGTSLSGQYGKRFDLNEKFFVEPSMELTLGRVDSADYTTSADVKVHQDSMYSLVGNVGIAVGYKFSDKGNIYARASFVKEFQGDIDSEFYKDNSTEKVSEDLSDTWAEFGVGANYRFTENMNVYVDVERTGDSTVDTKWQGNLGFRYEF